MRSIAILVVLTFLVLPLGGCGGEEVPEKPPVVKKSGPDVDTPDVENPLDEEAAAVAAGVILEASCVSCHGMDKIEEASKSEEEWAAQVRGCVADEEMLSDEDAGKLVEHLTVKYGR